MATPAWHGRHLNSGHEFPSLPTTSALSANHNHPSIPRDSRRPNAVAPPVWTLPEPRRRRRHGSRRSPPETPRPRSLGRSAASLRGHERYRSFAGPRLRGSAAAFGLARLFLLLLVVAVSPSRRFPGRARLQPGRGLRQQLGLACGGEPGPLGARGEAEILFRRGHRVRGQETAAARVPLRPSGLAGSVPAGRPRRPPLRCQRPRPLYPGHGLPHLHPPRRPRFGHPKQVLPGQPGAGGQLGPGLAAAGGAQCPAQPLPGDRQRRPDARRPRGLCWLQIRGDDRGARGRAAPGQGRVLRGLELVLFEHFCVHDPHAEAEAALGGGGRGRFGARGQKSAEDVPDHGHRCRPAPLHVLAHLPPAQVSGNHPEKSRNSQEKIPEFQRFSPKKFPVVFGRFNKRNWRKFWCLCGDFLGVYYPNFWGVLDIGVTPLRPPNSWEKFWNSRDFFSPKNFPSFSVTSINGIGGSFGVFVSIFWGVLGGIWGIIPIFGRFG